MPARTIKAALMWTIAAAIVATLILVVIVINFRTPEKKIQHQVRHLYGMRPAFLCVSASRFSVSTGPLKVVPAPVTGAMLEARGDFPGGLDTLDDDVFFKGLIPNRYEFAETRRIVALP